jgi:hypothetical protein
MKRRSFLALLGLAPVVATTKAEAAEYAARSDTRTMGGTSIYEWSAGQSPSAVNASARQMMKRQTEFLHREYGTVLVKHNA